MKKWTKDQTIYLLGGIIIVLVIAIIATVLLLQPQNYFNLKNDSNKIQEELEYNHKDKEDNNQQEEMENPQEDNQSEDNQSAGETEEEQITNQEPPVATPTPPIENQNPVTPTYTENDVIEYFETASNNLDQQNDQNNSSFVDKAKNAFTTVVDFIFYDKEINGYTFSELTTSAKMKVIEIALKIDSKINEYFPNYKDSIKAGYENIKGKLAYAYLEITSSLCEAVGTDTCEQAKEDFNNMKKSFSFTFDLIKELAKSGASKVKEFYENTFKD